MLALMAGDTDGTWFTAEEASDLGLVDEIIAPDTEGEPNPVVDPPEEQPDPEMAKAMASMAAMRRRLSLAEQD